MCYIIVPQRCIAGSSPLHHHHHHHRLRSIPISKSLPESPCLFPDNLRTRRRNSWRISLALNTGGGIPGNNGGPGQDNINDNNSGDNNSGGLGRTRLSRLVSTGGRQLLEKLNSARKNFPMKVFLLLLGFYTANALATILGQTGDWDVLVAGVVVAAIEGIGMLMYRNRKPTTPLNNPLNTPLSKSNERFQSLVVMVNFWKAGICLGLFVDAFKLGS